MLLFSFDTCWFLSGMAGVSTCTHSCCYLHYCCSWTHGFSSGKHLDSSKLCLPVQIPNSSVCDQKGSCFQLAHFIDLFMWWGIQSWLLNKGPWCSKKIGVCLLTHRSLGYIFSAVFIRLPVMRNSIISCLWLGRQRRELPFSGESQCQK